MKDAIKPLTFMRIRLVCLLMFLWFLVLWFWAPLSRFLFLEFKAIKLFYFEALNMYAASIITYTYYSIVLRFMDETFFVEMIYFYVWYLKTHFCHWIIFGKDKTMFMSSHLK